MDRISPTLETLEQRLLYAADAPAALALEAGQTIVQAAQSPSAPQTTAQRSELVLIDSRVDDPTALIADLQAQRDAGRNIDWRVIATDRDGLEQVGEALRGQRDLDALHIVSHGQAGELLLGNGVLDIDTLRSRSVEIAGWAASLSVQADLLLYGCDLAADARGAELMDGLAMLTGADIAASVNTTGTELQGGDWLLEQQTGAIDSTVAFSEPLQVQWQGTLNIIETAGTEHRINSDTSGKQITPDTSGGNQIAYFSNGAYVAVWTIESGRDVFARIFDANDVALTGDILVNSNSSDDVYDPVVAVDHGSNRAVIAWSLRNGDVDNHSIMMRVLDAGGGFVNPADEQVNTTVAGQQTRPAIAISSTGQAIITFSSEASASDSRLNILARTYDVRTGAWTATDWTVNADPGDGTNQDNSSVAFTSATEAVVVWQSDNQDAAGTWGVYGRLVSGTGVQVLASEFLVNSNVSEDQFNPSVAANGGGQFVVSYTESTSQPNIRAQRFDAVGAKVGVEIDVNQVTSGDQINAAAAMASDGSFVIAWQSDNQSPDGSNFGIFARHFDAAGLPMQNEFLLNETVSKDQYRPSLAINGSELLAIWSGKGGGDGDGIYARAFQMATPRVVLTSDRNTTSEAGVNATLSVVLAAPPDVNTVVSLVSSDTTEGRLSANVLTFTTSNWQVAQTVTVSGQDDAYIDGDLTYLVSAKVISGDPYHLGLPTETLAFRNADNDTFNTLTVTTAADLVDGDFSSVAALIESPGGDGKISLREALLAANLTANGPGGADHIHFNLPGGSVLTTLTALPGIADPVVIDGRSNPGYGTSPMLLLTAGNGTNWDGLAINGAGAGSQIYGMAIGGFGGNGIRIEASNVVIDGNHIGVRIDGTSAIGNGGMGIRVAALDASTLSGITIRGNLISANGGSGISAASVSDSFILNNRIGVNAVANSSLGNAGYGIDIGGTSNANTLNWNLIGANQAGGIRLAGDVGNQVVTHNWIGVNAGLSTSLANGGSGILLTDGASNNRIGGTAIGDGNWIYNHTTGAGIEVRIGTSTVPLSMAAGNSFLGNAIENSQMAIRLEPFDGAPWTPLVNDAVDADSGVNELQNSPQLISADVVLGGTGLRVQGSLQSSRNGSYRIEFFADPTPNGNGYGDAPTFLGFVDVSTDATGFGSFDTTMTANVNGGTQITATATRTNNSFTQYLETSELSANVTASVPPVWVSAPAYSVNEGNLAVTTLNASDPMGGPVTYQILPGGDSAQFNLAAATGQLQFNLAPDYEAPVDAGVDNIYNLTVRATGRFGSYRDLALSVTVTNVNESPVWVSAAAQGVPEGSVNVATLQASDPDAGTILTYTISGGVDQSLFRLATDGRLQFLQAPNFEQPVDADADNSYRLQVRVGDGSLSSTLDLVVTVSDVNEPPVFQSATAVAVLESAPAVMTVQASDVDAGTGPLQYSIAAGLDGALFEIDAASGVLRFISPADFEAPRSLQNSNRYQVSLQVADGNGAVAVQTLVVQVLDRNEPAQIFAPAEITLNEDTAFLFGQAPGTGVIAVDPDSIDAPVRVLVQVLNGQASLASVDRVNLESGNPEGDVDLTFTGTLADVVATLQGLRFTPAANYFGTAALQLQFTDLSDPSVQDNRSIAVQLTPVNDMPVMESTGPLIIELGETATISPAALRVTDVEDTAQAIIYTIRSLPLVGEVRLDNMLVGIGSQFSQADVASGRLTWTASAAASSVQTLTLSAKDSGGAELAPVTVNAFVTAPAISDQRERSTSSAAKIDGAGTVIARPAGDADGALKAGTLQPSQASISGLAAGAPLANIQKAAAGSESLRIDARSAGAGEHRRVEPLHFEERTIRMEAAPRSLSFIDNRRDLNPIPVDRIDPVIDARVRTMPTRLQPVLQDNLNRVREQVVERVTIERNIVASSMALSTSISIGYVIWLIRGGVLLSSLLASVPAWSSIDPLPILSSTNDGKDKDREDDSLQALLKKAARASARASARQSRHAAESSAADRIAEPTAASMPHQS